MPRILIIISIFLRCSARSKVLHIALAAVLAKLQEGTQFEALSEYEPGMDRRRIDWKASARSNEMMVRIMSREQRMEMAVLLDCGRTSQLQVGNLNQLHHYVNVVARLSELAVSHGDHIACGACGTKHKVVRGDKVRLVPLDREKHLEHALKWFNDPEITEWLETGDWPLTRGAEEEFLRKLSADNGGKYVRIE